MPVQLLKVASALSEGHAKLSRSPVVTGFDGFVDHMIHLVGQRHSLDRFDRVQTITEFSQVVGAAAGRSFLKEIIITGSFAGGCCVNMGDGLASAGVPVHTFATLGSPIHEAFADYGTRARLTSWGKEVCQTFAFEFGDGKLMFSTVGNLAHFTPEAVASWLADGTYAAACAEARLIALTDWSLFPHMTACWRLLLREVYGQLKHRPRFLFDLVDPSSRTPEDIREMLGVMREFQAVGPVTLSLNQNEANVLSRVLDGRVPVSSDISVANAQAGWLRSQLALDEVVIHAHTYAVGRTADCSESCGVEVCRQPKKSTGAGDRFNAGLALGYLLELTLGDRLVLGNATAGFFVRNGRSASLLELERFVEQWHSGGLAEPAAH